MIGILTTLPYHGDHGRQVLFKFNVVNGWVWPGGINIEAGHYNSQAGLLTLPFPENEAAGLYR